MEDLTSLFCEEYDAAGEAIPWWAVLALILVAVLCLLMFVPLVAAAAS